MSRGHTLKNLSDVRRFAARIANLLFKDKIDVNTARALFYAASVLKDLIKDSDIENRINALEKLQDGKK